MTNELPTLELFQAGQSPWLDNISRDLLRSGALKNMIETQGLKGVTSNPAIFQKAISSSGNAKTPSYYEADIRKFLGQGMSTIDIYDGLTIADIRDTCDLFLPIYTETSGEHGFVSLEVLPNLAYDKETTLSEARRLFRTVDRPNLLIKVPATNEGVAAVETLISEGVSVNITLMFSLKHYQDVAEAYVKGLEVFSKKGGDLSKVHSVASVFVSRVDSYVDAQLDELIQAARDLEKKSFFDNLKGKSAVANSKIIYQEFKKIFYSQRFKKLQAEGAHIQKVLWGSTSVKNSTYPDLLYVDTLVGENTVNTMPQVTFDALLDHGDIEVNTVEEALPEARDLIRDLKTLGIDLEKVGDELQVQGVESFVVAFDLLMKSLEEHYEKKQKRLPLAKIKCSLPDKTTEKTVIKNLSKLKSDNFLSRFFNLDPAVWKREAVHQSVIANRMGWLHVHDWILGKLYEIDLLVADVMKDKIKDVVLLGMGGSSLAPEVMSLICDRKATKVGFAIVDTTDPTSILNIEKKLDLKKTLFIVASKSGGTVETLSQFDYFYKCVSDSYGAKTEKETIGKHFIAITDKGSDLQSLATQNHFRKTFINPTDIGGRFSAMSLFGMVPAALMGIDVRAVVRSARSLFETTKLTAQFQKNPGIYLGALFAQLASEGHDKVTFFSSKKLASFGCWLEQLIAESIGKEGKGIIPIEGEQILSPAVYGKDRAFVFSKIKGESSSDLTKAAARFKKAGFPIIEIEWSGSEAIGEAFLMWEIVTAVAGAIMDVNPFDEPNVTESKNITKKILKNFEKTGKLDEPQNILKTNKDCQTFLSTSVKEGGYIALLAYLERTPEAIKAFDSIRKLLQEAYKVPVLLGFGPRYLHSIGQLYKGGPLNGTFLEFLVSDVKDVQVPNQKYSFGQLKMAQALGDYEAMVSKQIPAATIELGKDALKGLAQFEKQLNSVL